MTVFQSNTDALLVAVPMIGILFAGYFRLDELFGKPKLAKKSRRPVSGWDKYGKPIVSDPDFKPTRPEKSPRAER